jgi:O-antigen ligase/polysaccharide polymerase Wzy-like membrane protein
MQATSLLACCALAVASVIDFHFLDPAAPKPGLLHFYARVGRTSTVALIAISVFAAMAAVRGTRAIGMIGILLCMVIGAATLNRFFWIALAVVAVVLLWRRVGATRERRRSCLVLGTLLLAMACAMAFNNRERLMALVPATPAAVPSSTMQAAGNAQPPTGAAAIGSLEPHRVAGHASSHDLFERLRCLSSIDAMSSRDTRPKIWAFYISQVHTHPWLGVGFGKPLPSIAYGKLVPATLFKFDANVKTHAHNLFLNTLLQTGVIGLVLQLALFTSVAWRFIASRATRPIVCRAGLALLLGMLAKNMTDDFMWQSTALMFWACCGWLLGQCEATFAQRTDTSVRDTGHRFALQLHEAPVAARAAEQSERTV